MRNETSIWCADSTKEKPLKFLDEALIEKIDHALCRAGDFGQVRLVIVKGRLRFIEVTQSESVKDT
jgi:hypothetical protein